MEDLTTVITNKGEKVNVIDSREVAEMMGRTHTDIMKMIQGSGKNLGIIPILMSMVYAIIGIKQLIKRKSINKVDTEIIILGIFYIVVISIYILFEKYIINYRPILMNGFLEASFPSSHTLMTVCLCGSSIIINNKLFKNNFTKILNFLSLFIIIIMIIGRFISGVHWLTDIIGGMLISSFLLILFYSVVSIKERK